MPFYPASKNATAELLDRMNSRNNLRSFGISFLDDALIGIGPGDLVLLGAPSGVGKTQLCCNIAKANIEKGRKVHFFALESDEFEIERRLKYEIISKAFFESVVRPEIPGRLNFERWRMGDYVEYMAGFESAAIDTFERHYGDLLLHHKAEDKFGISEMIESVVSSSSETDLFIIDHAHYFDFEDENENRAMKKLARTVRHLAIDEKRPIILVAHLRKRDKGNQDLVPDMDEFHGSSDLFKIATRVITMAPGGVTPEGHYETFFRVPKNRFNGGSKYYISRMLFNPKKGRYENEYRLGPATLTRDSGFQDIDSKALPEWATNVVAQAMGSSDNSYSERKSFTRNKSRKGNSSNVRRYSEKDEE